MVTHSYECATGHVFDAVVNWDERIIRCQGRTPRNHRCRRLAERVFLPPRTRRNALGFTPVTYFQDAKGDLWVPPRSDTTTLPAKLKRKLARDGFTERHISNFREYERFCAERTRKCRADNDRAVADNSADRSVMMQTTRDMLNQGVKVKGVNGLMRLQDMQPGTRAVVDAFLDAAQKGDFSDLGPEVLGSMDAVGLETAQLREIADLRQRSAFDPQVHIEAMEYDRSYYRDADTGWGKRY
jgi:hypothetical protein